MAYVKWTFALVLFAVLAAFLHYSLPQRDVVRVVGTEVKREDETVTAADGDTEVVTRDVRQINAFDADGSPRVYRNEDTGFGWPPYFKFDSATLQTEAADLVSTRAEPEWVAVRHYGWRSEWLSIYPNALGIRAVEGPDARLVPWTAIVVLLIFAALAATLVRLWLNFKDRRIDPLFEGDRSAPSPDAPRRRPIWQRWRRR